MPGIAGILSKAETHLCESQLNTMLNLMLHENTFVHGTYMSAKAGVYASWVCHKDSFCDCMPVWNEKKDVTLIYFGENFTDLDLFDRLKAKHHRFDPTNASYLVHMYEEKGLDFLIDLNGWFCGILIDHRTGQSILFNDRFGMQKIFYHEDKNAFYFSSEAKSLLAVSPSTKALNTQSLAEYLSCSCVLENRSLYNCINLLPPASAYIFQNDQRLNKCYFNPSTWQNQTWLGNDFFYDRLKDTFKKILLRYSRATQKIGISLTGGVDTRLIMTYMDMPEGKYPCYTFGGMYRDSFDVTLSRRIATLKNQTHNTIIVGEEFLNSYSHWVEKTVFLSDGYVDASNSSEIYLNKIAAEIAPIRLTGEFGGEILRSLTHIKPSPLVDDLFDEEINQYSRHIQDTLDIYHKDPLSFVIFNESPWHNNNKLAIQQSQLTMRTPFMDNDLIALLYRLQLGFRRDKSISLRLISDGDPILAGVLTDKGLGGKLFYPFSLFVHRLYEFLAKAEYAYDYGMPQWLARLDHSLSFAHLERLFLGRHKLNHYRLWYRDQLSSYIKEILLDERTLSRPYLNRKVVENIVSSHTGGVRNYSTSITKLLTIEMIQRLMLE